MSQATLIGTGRGYEGCTAFDGFDIIAAPLPGYDNEQRKARIFERAAGHGTDYGSHTVALAVRTGASKYHGGSDLYILVSHGAGREVWHVPSFYDGGEYERALLAMPERQQYAALYTLYRMASGAREQGIGETRREYTQAFVEKRLKKSRPKQGRVTVRIEPRSPISAQVDTCP